MLYIVSCVGLLEIGYSRVICGKKGIMGWGVGFFFILWLVIEVVFDLIFRKIVNRLKSLVKVESISRKWVGSRDKRRNCD